MQKKLVKLSLLVISLMLSLTIPIIAVTAKKKDLVNKPIYINELITGKRWIDYVDEPWLKGRGTEEEPYKIKKLVIDGQDSPFCLEIWNSLAYFIVEDCTFSNNKPILGEISIAVSLHNTQNGVISKNQIFGSGIPGSNSGTGIALIESSNNIIEKNYCYNNVKSGIVVSGSHGNTISDNICSNNGESGIAIVDLDGLNAIDNIVSGNTLENNYYGVFLSNVDNNDVVENTIRNNYKGIELEQACESNIIYHNNIIENTQQAWDDNTWSNNWNGNYWSDYPGVDDNDDDIGDTFSPWQGYDYAPFVGKNMWDNSAVLNDVLNPEHKIKSEAILSVADTNYIVPKMGQSIPERRQFIWDLPYTLQILIDGEEIELKTFWWNDKEGILYGEPFFWQVFYHIFEPYSLGIGTHSFEIIYTYYNGAGPDRLQATESWSNTFTVE